MDGIDCSFIKTDGKYFVSIIRENSYQYSQNYRNKLKKIIKFLNINKCFKKKYIKDYEVIVTNKFIQIIKKFIKESSIEYTSIDYISVSGQTVFHDPKNKKTIQLGSCKKIQNKLKLKIVGNFRDNDIKNGGQGAPIGAMYHKFILKKFSSSSAIINLGGISNISFVNKNELIAFDVGPGNTLIDDLMLYFYKKTYDKYGEIAFKGKLNKKLINIFKNDSFFKLKYPKSLDREYFRNYFKQLKKIKIEDSIHTASMMTVKGILLGLKILNKKTKTIILTGGGRKNLFILNFLKKELEKKGNKIILIDKLNFDGDLLEAQAFAYLAIRSVRNLPISYPTTTGVKKPTLGGIIYK